MSKPHILLIVFSLLLAACAQPTADSEPTPATTTVTERFADDLPDATSAETYAEFVTVTDRTGTLQVRVPAEWDQTNGLGWQVNGETIGVGIRAAKSLDGFYGEWGVPGVFVGISEQITPPDQFLDADPYTEICTSRGRSAFDNGRYEGFYDAWNACENIDNMLFLNMAAVSKDGTSFVQIQTVAVSQADLDAIDQIFDSFILSTE